MEIPKLSLDQCVDKLRALGAEKFELTFERASSLSIEIKDGKVDHLSQSTDQGLSIRALKEGRMGFSYTFDLSREAVEMAAQRALEVGSLMPSDTLNDLGGSEGGKNFSGLSYPKTDCFDPDGIKIPLEEKIELARRIEADAKALDPRIKRVRKAGYGQATGVSALMDSQGQLITYPSTSFSAGLLCVAEEGTDAETGHDSRSSTFFSKMEADKVARTAVECALEGLHGTACPTMECPAVFKNSVVADLIDFLSPSFSAENVDKQSSMLAGKRGQKLFSDHILLLDDALRAGGTSTSPFDAEGSPSRQTTLVRNGVVENFLYDAYYARKHKTATTGSSRRGSLKAPPSVGSSNLYLAAGARPKDELVRSAGRGIYITDLLGLHTSNAVTGDFSVGANGVLIENGVLTKPVKGFAIAGNLISLLRDVTEVGSDLRFWGSVGAPSLLVSKLAVSGA